MWKVVALRYSTDNKGGVIFRRYRKNKKQVKVLVNYLSRKYDKVISFNVEELKQKVMVSRLYYHYKEALRN